MSLAEIRADAVKLGDLLLDAMVVQQRQVMRIDALIARTRGIWISPDELARLPTRGPAWEALRGYADWPHPPPALAENNSPANTATLARALVYARTGATAYRDMVMDALRAIVDAGTYSGDALALGRNLAAYVISADLVGLPRDMSLFRLQWRAKLRELRSTPTTGAAANLVDSHERRPNNWGTMAGASRIAIALYLDDRVDLDRAATVFRGYLGERGAYSGFVFGGPFQSRDHSWEADESAPVGINPRGATKAGLSIDGVLPDDQRRGGPITGGITRENYVWEALQGAVVQGTLLHRAGYPAWSWGDQALLRALTWLHDVADFPAVGDDRLIPWLANHYLGTTFPAEAPTSPGKVMAFTCWTHS
jgi:hypothetical protein